jgi:hypothetical protein
MLRVTSRVVRPLTAMPSSLVAPLRFHGHAAPAAGHATTTAGHGHDAHDSHDSHGHDAHHGDGHGHGYGSVCIIHLIIDPLHQPSTINYPSFIHQLSQLT